MKAVIGCESQVTCGSLLLAHLRSWPPFEGRCGCAAAPQCDEPLSPGPPAPTPHPGHTLVSAAAKSHGRPARLEGGRG